MKFQYLGAMLLIGMAGSAAAQTTTLAQLRSQLQGMHATAPLSVQVTLTDTNSKGDKDKPKVVTGEIALRVEDGSNGLQISLPAPVLARATRESAQAAAHPDMSTPTRSALGKLDPVMLQGMADFAPVLLRKLVGATLTAQQDAQRDGQPVHELTFSLPSQAGADMKSAIDHYQGSMTVWLGRDGVPVAVHEARQYKGSKFFIHFAFYNDDSYDLEQIGQRLVVRHYRGRQGGSGMGNNSKSTLDVGLTPVTVASTPTPAPAGKA